MTGNRELRALLDLARALSSSRSARVRFRETERSTAERNVDVLALAFEPPRWVVATWSPERRSLRLLDLTRVLRVGGTRRRAGPPPEGFDPFYFAVRWFLDGSGPPTWVTVRLEPPWGVVARVLVPSCELTPEPGGAALLRVRATRPEIVRELVQSLCAPGAMDSPTPKRAKPERR